MYRYDDIDQAVVDQRVAEFRDQTRRFLAGELSEDEFRPLRLRNGLYIQRHAPMLRIAIPYGLLSTRQLRKLAFIARTLRPQLRPLHHAPEPAAQLARARRTFRTFSQHLASVQMHAIQTSGNCVRNVTADHLAGVAPDEIDDPRPYCEIIRQWSTLHPEFTYLPRKFKIAVTGSPEDRAASEVHDIGLHMQRDAEGDQIGFKVFVGGGLGRTPIIGQVVREFLPLPDLLSYLEAILRVYNRYGRRDNIHKARIKILVKSLGIEEFREQVEAEWQRVAATSRTQLDMAEVERVRALLHAAAVREAGDYRRRRRPRARVPDLVSLQHAPAQGARLSRRVRFAEEARHRSGRHDLGPDGSRRGPRGSRELRPRARHAQPEPAARGREAERSLQAVDGAASAWALRCRTSARSRT